MSAKTRAQRKHATGLHLAHSSRVVHASRTGGRGVKPYRSLDRAAGARALADLIGRTGRLSEILKEEQSR